MRAVSSLAMLKGLFSDIGDIDITIIDIEGIFGRIALIKSINDS